MWWTGFAMSAVVVLFLLMDSGMKLAAIQPVLEAGQQIGFPGTTMARKLGAVLLVCTLLYVWPRTAVLGAVLFTGLFGATMAIHWRVGDPLFSHILFGFYLALLAWGGLWMRDARLRAVLPLSAGHR